MFSTKAGRLDQLKRVAVISVWLVISMLMIAQQQTTGQNVEKDNRITAKIIARDSIAITFATPPQKINPRDFIITPAMQIHQAVLKEGVAYLKTDPIDLSVSHYLEYKGARVEIQPDKVLDTFFSDKTLGCVWNDERTIFRVFAPRASAVTLVLFDRYDAQTGTEHEMLRDMDGVWEVLLPGHYFGMYYAYKVNGPQSPTEMFDATKLLCDPYSRAVVTRNEYLHRGKTLILDTSNFNWEGDEPLRYKWEDLIIYECHVRDMTAHSSSGALPELAGSYTALIQQGLRGGIEYIKSLGVNAVELLPIHDFGNIELPYGVAINGLVNTWNPYARNHWGYMTSYFFAPESYYVSGGRMTPDDYSGIDGRQVNEFKNVVKAFHREGIAVILDVVYNHVAQYDQNSFKYIDKKYYFRLNDDQTFSSASGCGNDFKTERPMARRLILDSIKYWMQEYHVDGFRFDLAAMIDEETIDAILREARKINPDVIIIAEPWGGGKYDPAGFSRHGWAAWNDQFRNGIKGQNPENGQGFIFGRWWDYNNRDIIKRYICGDLAKDGGLFIKSAHAVNYLESHDDYTFGDFIRIGTGEVKPDQVITDITQNARLSERQLKLNKLGALILFTSQGPVMIAEGQEFARSKVIARTDVPDDHVGQIDHNSYNKDNETNWLNYEHADLNRELVDYYRGLVALRKKHPAFRRSPKKAITFFDNDNPFALGYLIDKTASGDSHNFLVFLNANADQEAQFDLPEGVWSLVVDAQRAGAEPLRRMQEKVVTLPATSGLVLRQE